MTWLHSLALVYQRSGGWMLWNTVLAWAPVVLAVLLFRRTTDRRGPVWWCGVVAFGLFLPNSPYVVTDLIHVGPTIHSLGAGVPVWTAVVPVYTLLVASGFVAYALALGMAGSYLGRNGLGRWRLPLRFVTHALVAVGIFLGRWPRLNSWEPFTDPSGALHRIGDALAWSEAPRLILLLFAVTALGHALTHALIARLLPRSVGAVHASGP